MLPKIHLIFFLPALEDEAQGFFEFFPLGFLGISRNAGHKVVRYDHRNDLVDSRLHCGKLCHDFFAFAVVFEHLGYASNLSFDPVEPIDILLVIFQIPSHLDMQTCHP